jgi:Ankyrin repeats (3 copies)
VESKTAEQKLIEAIRWGNRIEVLRVIKEGASIRTKDEYGNDVILMAGGLGHWLIVNDLLLCGADVEAQVAVSGNRLVHFAAADGNWNIICQLMHFKPSLNVVNNFGDTPLDLARRNKRHRVVELLEQNGARANAEMRHIKDILDVVASDYAIQHFGEKYACLCNHGLSRHSDETGRCEEVIRRPNGDEELCTCDAFADVWGREVPIYQPENRALFSDYDLERY